LIELLDELVDGVRQAAWPSIRQELGLSYFQIGLLLSVPTILSGMFEPILGIMADARRRRILVLAGGTLFGVSLLLTAASPGFWLLMLSFVLFYPASGGFVTLSQAELMDRDPARNDQNMARWTLAGSVGAALGPLSLGAAAGLGLGWRPVYALIGVLAAALVILAARVAFPALHGSAREAAAPEEPARPSPAEAQPPATAAAEPPEHPLGLREGLREALRSLREWEVVRWLVLLEVANLMLDVFFGFLALYFVDVAGVSVAQAALAVTVWTVAEMAGDLLLIPILERLSGLRYLRVSAAAVAVVFPLFLIVEPFAAKLALVALLGLLRAGWYSILQARLYSSLPGRSNIAIALTNVAGIAGGLIPLGLGALAEAAGLHVAMWVLLAAPLALVALLPRAMRS
jgi:MFS transporter, FSR family, fosmidomycin resistance protein